MKKSDKPLTLYCSRLFSVPILDSILYPLQNWFLDKGYTDTIFMSRRITTFQSQLIKKISKENNSVIIKSLKFEKFLRHFDSEIILDIFINDYRKLSKDNIFTIFWCLVYAKAVTQTTKKCLKKIIPSNFPVK